MWTSNEYFPKTKVVALEKLHKFGIQHFFIRVQKDRENFSLPRSPWKNQKLHLGPVHCFLQRLLSPAPYAAGGPCPPCGRGELDP